MAYSLPEVQNQHRIPDAIRDRHPTRPTVRYLIISLILPFVLLACSEGPVPVAKKGPVLDAVDMGTYLVSVAAVTKELTPEKKKEFDDAAGALILHHALVELKKTSTISKDMTLNSVKKMNGLTADEVIAQHKKLQVAPIAELQKQLLEKQTALMGAANRSGTNERNAWLSDEKIDGMRNERTIHKYINSDNDVMFAFPYNGGSFLSIWLRQNSSGIEDAYLIIARGQFQCHQCQISVKFDDGKVTTYRAYASPDGRPDLIFISNPKQFISNTKKAKTFIVELPFYQEGTQQFTFQSNGFPSPV
jgi:hypothetical protein